MPTFQGEVDVSSGKNQSLNNLSTDGTKGYIIGAETGYTIVVKYGAHSKSLYPGTVDYFPVDASFYGSIDFQVTSKLNNISQWPSAFLRIDRVGINEHIDERSYPMPLPRQVSVGNTLSTTGVQTLSNEGQAINTLVIDIGPSGNNQMLEIWNDHFIWSVVQGGVAHQVLKGNTAGNPLQIGASGDVSEVLGHLTVDQAFIATLTAVISGLLTASAGLIVNGSTAPTIDISGATGTSGIKWQGGKTTTRQTSGFNAVTTTGTAITHGLGTTPSGVAGGPSTATSFSITAIGATTFTVTVGANCNFSWIATAN